MSGGITSYMPPAVVAKVPECPDLETQISMSVNFGLGNNEGMVLSSNGNGHHDYYERSLYDEFTMKQQLQQQLTHQRAASAEATTRAANSGPQRFLSSTIPPNSYANNRGNPTFRSYSQSSSITTPQNHNLHQLQIPGFNGSKQTTQNISNGHNYAGKGIIMPTQPILNSSANSSNSELSEEVGSLAALDGLTDLLPMMPTSEAVKLSLRDIDGVDDENNGKPLTNNNSLVLIGSSPTSPNPSINGSSGSMTLKNWDESGSMSSSSSHSSTFSSSETPPPLTPTSLYHLQSLKSLYHQPDTNMKLTGTTLTQNFHTGLSSNHQNSSHLEFACSAPEVTSLLLSDFGVSVSNSDAEWLDNLIKL